jgi:hypothetical protein
MPSNGRPLEEEEKEEEFMFEVDSCSTVNLNISLIIPSLVPCDVCCTSWQELHSLSGVVQVWENMNFTRLNER